MFSSFFVAKSSSCASYRKSVTNEACKEYSGVLRNFCGGEWGHSKSIPGLQGGIRDESAGKEELVS